jgi:hypothetical protein
MSPDSTKQGYIISHSAKSAKSESVGNEGVAALPSTSGFFNLFDLLHGGLLPTDLWPGGSVGDFT